MKPRDWDGPDDPAEVKKYLDALHAWEAKRDQLVARQSATRDALEATERRVGILDGWTARLKDQFGPMEARATDYRAVLAAIITESQLADRLEGDIADLRQTFATATSRLLNGPPLSRPVVLLPLRLETRWRADELLVRIYPDTLSVDSHRPSVSALEAAAGDAYWSVPPTDQSATGQAWEQLVRQVGPARAAWVVRCTDPSAPQPSAPGVDEAPRATARLLPDRFVGIVLVDGLPADVAPPGDPARFMTWGQPVVDDVAFEALDHPTAATWLTDFATAEQAGMALRIPVAGQPGPLESLLVIGLRTAGSSDLGSLLLAHGFSDGLEILSDATPTNNSAATRATHSREHEAEVGRALTRPGTTADPASAGWQLADLLGVPADQLATVAGGADPRGRRERAMAILAGLAATGVLRDRLGAAGDTAWASVAPSGPSPAFRVGRQPYGVLPATPLSRWVAAEADLGSELAPHLHEWARATGPSSFVDPADPPQPPTAGQPRVATSNDGQTLLDLMVESPHSLAWSLEDTSVGGVAALVGPDGQTGPPAAYLHEVAATAPDNLPDDPAFGAGPVLRAVAIAAKRSSPSDKLAEVDAALDTLAQVADDDDGRLLLTRLLSVYLDAVSHRFDAWATGVVADRLRQLRAGGDAGSVGAYGWLTDLAPREGARSRGHIHAPSLAQATTAAVLRSGYRQQGGDGTDAPERDAPFAVDLSSERVRRALEILRAVRAGQPLGAALGYRFERHLAEARLQQYMLTFRKLTRFQTGTALDQLDIARGQTRGALEAAEQQLDGLRHTAALAKDAASTAQTELAARQSTLDSQVVAAQPYTLMRTRRDRLRDVDVPQLRALLAAAEANPPKAATHTETIKIPVPDP